MQEVKYQITIAEQELRLSTQEKNEETLMVVAKGKNYLVLKRIVDVVLSVILILTILTWLIPLLGLIILISSRGPVFFFQKRVGLYGRIFTCIKFRSMIVNKEADEKPAIEKDERITQIGKFLRRTNIDEIPQLFNVLAGDMSMTGPRPHMIADCHRFSFIISSYEFRNLVKPGITGLAQIKGYRGPSADYESIQKRFFWDAEYVRTASMTMDLKILSKTMLYFISGWRKKV